MEINWSLVLREKQRLQGPTTDNQEDIVPKEGGITGWEKMAIEELRGLYSSSNTIQVIKTQRMRRPRQVGGRGVVHIGFT
jgi:hypothetical protein